MKQIITGPFGRMAYYNANAKFGGQYPTLNLPNCDFARGAGLVAANGMLPPNVIKMPRKTRTGAAIAMFGEPTKRKS
ncbi:hypothetical protein [Sulfitobacter donghicola]|uniref:Uncharacterized protein n=1 Tax=Sulfitobacter donghicola DSW-25 = KCTC 12864 = JCM 14565 TaxID=1300350 RepID=A0A073IY60_9RHOB|nr:hypothetical protein [Sulfitobacter donghicola]KEJ90327.1 hypothetical protein DSW25_07720 [Sulfitobacter donghicola DSW-25 = KCTC 12864 = JCM 14565]KIN66768.1 hypothetical protein Z948_471 [Sulfitobacter donghicola DSW-25 = KCTC 12864 = JCM 14565]